MVPPIMECLSSIQGYISLSDIKKSACFKVLWFTIWNVFFATVFSGTALSQLSLVFEPKNIPTKLAVAVPGQVKPCVPMITFLEPFCHIVTFVYPFKPDLYDSMRFSYSVFGSYIFVYV